jgi:hypothetical protein
MFTSPVAGFVGEGGGKAIIGDLDVCVLSPSPRSLGVPAAAIVRRGGRHLVSSPE